MCLVNRTSEGKLAFVGKSLDQPDRLYQRILNRFNETYGDVDYELMVQSDPYLRSLYDRGILIDVSPEEIALGYWAKINEKFLNTKHRPNRVYLVQKYPDNQVGLVEENGELVLPSVRIKFNANESPAEAIMRYAAEKNLPIKRIDNLIKTDLSSGFGRDFYYEVSFEDELPNKGSGLDYNILVNTPPTAKITDAVELHDGFFVSKEVADKIENIRQNKKKIALHESEEYYYSLKNPDVKYMRTTRYTGGVVNISPAYAGSTFIGTGIDKLVRDALSRKIPLTSIKYDDYKEVTKRNSYTGEVETHVVLTEQAFNEALAGVTQFLAENPNLHFITDNLLTFRNMEGIPGYAGIAGEMDVLAVNQQGEFMIIDTKSFRNPSSHERNLLSKHPQQLSAYADSIEQTNNVKISSLAILGFQTTYPEATYRDNKPIEGFTSSSARMIPLKMLNRQTVKPKVALEKLTTINVKAYRTSDTFSSKVEYAQRGSGQYFALDKPFKDSPETGTVSKVEVSYNPARILDATTKKGQEEFLKLKKAAIQGRTFESIKESNDAVTEAMISSGYDSLIGFIDENNKSAGRELVIYTLQKPPAKPEGFADAILGQTAEEQRISNLLDNKINELTIQGDITFTDEENQPCAAFGGKTSFTKGSEWSMVKDLKGYPSHADGGVDIKLGSDGFSFVKDGATVKAAHGLVLPAIVAKNGLTVPADFEDFKKFNITLPDNLRDDSFKYGDYSKYDLYGMWEASGKPKSFDDVKDTELFPKQDDGTYHGFSVGNDGIWLKPETHSTAFMELMQGELSPELQDQTVIRREDGRLQYVKRNKIKAADGLVVPEKPATTTVPDVKSLISIKNEEPIRQERIEPTRENPVKTTPVKKPTPKQQGISDNLMMNPKYQMPRENTNISGQGVLSEKGQQFNINQSAVEQARVKKNEQVLMAERNKTYDAQVQGYDPTKEVKPTPIDLSTLKNPETVAEVQRLLVNKGYNLGKYGTNKDGVDGIAGRLTKKAIKEYNQSLNVPNVNFSYTYMPSLKENPAGTFCKEEQCSEYTAFELYRRGKITATPDEFFNQTGLGVNAWNTAQSIKSKGGSEIYNRKKQGGKIPKGVAVGDVVVMYTGGGSDYQKRADKEGDGNTHVGFVSKVNSDGSYYVSHNVHRKNMLTRDWEGYAYEDLVTPENNVENWGFQVRKIMRPKYGELAEKSKKTIVNPDNKIVYTGDRVIAQDIVAKVNNTKEVVANNLNLDEDEHTALQQAALGIIEQESKFGEAFSEKAASILPESKQQEVSKNKDVIAATMNTYETITQMFKMAQAAVTPGKEYNKQIEESQGIGRAKLKINYSGNENRLKELKIMAGEDERYFEYLITIDILNRNYNNFLRKGYSKEDALYRAIAAHNSPVKASKKGEKSYATNYDIDYANKVLDNVGKFTIDNKGNKLQTPLDKLRSNEKVIKNTAKIASVEK